MAVNNIDDSKQGAFVVFKHDFVYFQPLRIEDGVIFDDERFIRVIMITSAIGLDVPSGKNMAAALQKVGVTKHDDVAFFDMR